MFLTTLVENKCRLLAQLADFNPELNPKYRNIEKKQEFQFENHGSWIGYCSIKQ